MKNIYALTKLVSKDQTRPALQALSFEEKRVVATDGYILGYTDKDTQTISGEGLLDAKYITKKTQAVILNGEKAEVLGGLDESMIVPKTNANYVRYEAIIPTDEAVSHHTVSLGIGVLNSLVQTMKASGDKVVTLHFSADPLKPIKGKTGDIKLVLMPCRPTK